MRKYIFVFSFGLEWLAAPVLCERCARAQPAQPVVYMNVDLDASNDGGDSKFADKVTLDPAKNETSYTKSITGSYHATPTAVISTSASVTVTQDPSNTQSLGDLPEGLRHRLRQHNCRPRIVRWSKRNVQGVRQYRQWGPWWRGGRRDVPNRNQVPLRPISTYLVRTPREWMPSRRQQANLPDPNCRKHRHFVCYLPGRNMRRFRDHRSGA
jgi:hypothetical protein